MKAPLTFYEFFAGGGMARLGLGDDWECLLANDFDPAKAAAYRANFGGEHLREGDSFYFASNMKHRWSNPGKQEAWVLWVNTPPTF